MLQYEGDFKTLIGILMVTFSKHYRHIIKVRNLVILRVIAFATSIKVPVLSDFYQIVQHIGNILAVVVMNFYNFILYGHMFLQSCKTLT